MLDGGAVEHFDIMIIMIIIIMMDMVDIEGCTAEQLVYSTRYLYLCLFVFSLI